MISYKPLCRTLVEKEMSKVDLRKAANLAPNTMTKLRRDQEVSIDMLERICETLKIDYRDVITHIPDQNAEQAQSTDYWTVKRVELNK